MPNNKSKKTRSQLNLARIIFHVPNFMKLSHRLMRDKRVPFYLKAIVFAAFLYVLSPYDIIPDFLIPFLGMIEDVVIGILCLTGLVKLSPDAVVKEHVKAIDIENKNRFRFFR